LETVDFYLSWRGICILLKALIEQMAKDSAITHQDLRELERLLNEIDYLLLSIKYRKDQITP
jgi:hypothetical protein